MSYLKAGRKLPRRWWEEDLFLLGSRTNLGEDFSSVRSKWRCYGQPALFHPSPVLTRNDESANAERGADATRHLRLPHIPLTLFPLHDWRAKGISRMREQVSEVTGKHFRNKGRS